MKKLVFGLIATIMSVFVGNAQETQKISSGVTLEEYQKLDNVEKRIVDYIDGAVAALQGLHLNKSNNYANYQAILSMDLKGTDKLSNSIVIAAGEGGTPPESAQSCMVCGYGSALVCIRRIRTVMTNGTIVITVTQVGDCVRLEF